MSYVTKIEMTAARLCDAIYVRRKVEADAFEEYYKNLLETKVFDYLVFNKGTVTGLVEVDKVLYVVYRGTASKEDAYYDIKGGSMPVGLGKVRLGFFEGHTRTWSQTRDVLDSILAGVNAGTRELPEYVVFTGHSLGGASSLCAMLDCYDNASYDNFRTRLMYIGFAPPRTLSYGTAKRLHNIMSTRLSAFHIPKDIVPATPPLAFGWRHPLEVNRLTEENMERDVKAGFYGRFARGVQGAFFGVLTRAKKHKMEGHVERLATYPEGKGDDIPSISKGSKLYNADLNVDVRK